MARRRPSDPAAVAARRAAKREQDRDPAAWGLDHDALGLAAYADVETRADLAGRTVRARRRDAFDLLLARGGLSQSAFDAVRRLQDDIALLHRSAGGVASYAPRIDRTRTTDTFTDVRHRAGRRVEAALSLCGVASARLLAALVESAVALGRPADWRELVARETGERLADAQGAVLRAACENLAGAYAVIDGRRGL
jgi:hypothetical protein